MKPFREHYGKADADYAEFLRRMYSQDMKRQNGVIRLAWISMGIAACIAIIIYQLS